MREINLTRRQVASILIFTIKSVWFMSNQSKHLFDKNLTRQVEFNPPLDEKLNTERQPLDDEDVNMDVIYNTPKPQFEYSINNRRSHRHDALD